MMMLTPMAKKQGGFHDTPPCVRCCLGCLEWRRCQNTDNCDQNCLDFQQLGQCSANRITTKLPSKVCCC